MFDFERECEKKIDFQVKLNQFLSYGKFLVVQKPKWFPMVGDKKKNSMHPLIEKTYKIGKYHESTVHFRAHLRLSQAKHKEKWRKKCICTIPFELLSYALVTQGMSQSQPNQIEKRCRFQKSKQKVPSVLCSPVLII